jgi:hypothetical protein
MDFEEELPTAFNSEMATTPIKAMRMAYSVNDWPACRK